MESAGSEGFLMRHCRFPIAVATMLVFAVVLSGCESRQEKEQQDAQQALQHQIDQGSSWFVKQYGGASSPASAAAHAKGNAAQH